MVQHDDRVGGRQRTVIERRPKGALSAVADEYGVVRQSRTVLREMGLDADWAVRAIKAVGNYGEIFERNLGEQTPLQINRGINALWNAGGLLYAPPVR